MPHPNQVVSVSHPEHGMFVGLDPAKNYPDDDILVKTYPWAFTPLENEGQIVESVSIEDTTAEPGAKRRVTTTKHTRAR